VNIQILFISHGKNQFSKFINADLIKKRSMAKMQTKEKKKIPLFDKKRVSLSEQIYKFNYNYACKKCVLIFNWIVKV
jgi:hypothetical protein